MKAKVAALGICFGCFFLVNRMTHAQEKKPRLVRIVEIEIDAAQLAAYKADLRQEINASIRLEPGVLALYAVVVKNHPNQIRLFEIYAGEKAYRAHLQSAHFRKYKTATAGMVQSLTLVETDHLQLASR